MKLLSVPGFVAWMGYISSGGDPVLSLGIPAGIIIIGGATGIADGLSAGLGHRISEWIAGRPLDDTEDSENT